MLINTLLLLSLIFSTATFFPTVSATSNILNNISSINGIDENDDNDIDDDKDAKDDEEDDKDAKDDKGHQVPNEASQPPTAFEYNNRVIP